MSSVYEQEKERLGKIPRGGGGGGDFKWLDIPSPASKGQETIKHIRIIPRLPKGDDGQPDPSRPYPAFWVRVAVHRLTVDGEDKQFNCPDDPTNSAAQTTCPICKLRKDLQDARNSSYDELIKSLYPRVRCFCNVIDMGDPSSHWTDDGQGGWAIQPFVWGYSQTVHAAILDICINKGPVEDHELGRDLKIAKKRVGKRKMDVRYAIGEASDRKTLDESLMPVLYSAHGLEGLEKSTSADALRDVAALVDPRAGSARTTGGYSDAPPPTPAAPTRSAAPPPPASAPAPASGDVFFYDGPTGQQQDLDVISIARLIVGSGSEEGHAVWVEGWPDWADAMNVPEIAAAVVAQKPAPAAPPARNPPGYQPGGGYQVGGPPAPPQPPSGPPQPPTRAAGPPQPPVQRKAPPAPPRGKAPPPPPKPPGGPDNF